MNIAIISLGCPKNQVDADVFCHALIKAGHQTVADPEQADIIIVNTCGFIQSAKEEAIENILMACQYKQQNPNLKVIVTGCLAERYKTQIVSEMPEVDAVVGIGSNAALPAIVERLLGGESCALVTDAGTPAISDPGEDLVRLCGQEGITVQAIPGCCAAVCALAVSGLPTGRFCFEGFLSANKKERRTRLEELSHEERTMVFHEAPHKLRPTLADMLEVLGDRPVALCRELTKLHEETVRTTLAQAVELYQEKEPRGEYVLVVAGAEKAAAPAVTLDQGVRQVLRLRQEGVRMKDAVRRVAEDTGLPRNDLYNAALAEME